MGRVVLAPRPVSRRFVSRHPSADVAAALAIGIVSSHLVHPVHLIVAWPLAALPFIMAGNWIMLSVRGAALTHWKLPGLGRGIPASLAYGLRDVAIEGCVVATTLWITGLALMAGDPPSWLVFTCLALGVLNLVRQAHFTHVVSAAWARAEPPVDETGEDLDSPVDPMR